MSLTAFAKASPQYNNQDTKEVEQTIQELYSNKTIVLPTWKTADLGTKANIVTKLDLSQWNTDNLLFYNYTKETGALTKIKKPNYVILHGEKLEFTVIKNTGFVIITDTPFTIQTNNPTQNTSTAKSNAVYWTTGGKVYHSSKNCATLKRSLSIQSGTIAQSNKQNACKICS